KQSRFVPVPEHIHDTIEINYVYHGSYTQVINGQQLTLKQGDLIIIDTGIPHQTDALGTDDIIISMLIKQDFFTKYFYTELAPDTLLSKFILRAISESNNHNQYLFFRSNHFQ
ncbi:cupin domain-containing protein, partial [Streptococcus gallolyticus]